MCTALHRVTGWRPATEGQMAEAKERPVAVQPRSAGKPPGENCHPDREGEEAQAAALIWASCRRPRIMSACTPSTPSVGTRLAITGRNSTWRDRRSRARERPANPPTAAVLALWQDWARNQSQRIWQRRRRCRPEPSRGGRPQCLGGLDRQGEDVARRRARSG